MVRVDPVVYDLSARNKDVGHLSDSGAHLPSCPVASWVDASADHAILQEICVVGVLEVSRRPDPTGNGQVVSQHVLRTFLVVAVHGAAPALAKAVCVLAGSGSHGAFQKGKASDPWTP